MSIISAGDKLMNDSSLAAQLGFSPDDLAANRNGKLSDYQRGRLRFMLLRDTLLYGLFALVPFVILVVLLTAQSSSPFVLLILALLVLAFVVYIVNLQRSTRADLSGEVKVVTGRVDLRDVGRGIYRIGVGQQNFQVSAKVYYAFADGRFYRVYYTPNLKTILSAESAELAES